MSLKSYNSSCLNAGWFEERAAPLNGVMSDYGFKEWDTTTASVPHRKICFMRVRRLRVCTGRAVCTVLPPTYAISSGV